MDKSRFLGAILLVSGTSIGAGMLAIPVVTSFGGFFPSLLLLSFSWLFLFSTAWILLDVTLSFKKETNLVSMAGKTLGTWGRMICWVTYLLLLYSLTAAYIAGSAPLFFTILQAVFGQNVPPWLGPLPLLFVFGLFVYMGTKPVDWVNRFLMVGLILSYLFLVSTLPPHVDFSLISHTDFKAIWLAVPMIVTSFGFHIIIPTLATYLKHDKKHLRLSLFIGSLVPLIVYMVWNFLVLGTAPIFGEDGLSNAWIVGESSANVISHLLQNPWLSGVAKLFSFLAIVTSFLGVSLSLTDFLADGLKMKKFSFGRELSSFLTFFPPLFFVYAYPRGFIVALQYAGIFVAILLCIMPALMAWKLPAYKNKRNALFLVILISLFIIAMDVLEETGYLKTLISNYL